MSTPQASSLLAETIQPTVAPASVYDLPAPPGPEEISRYKATVATTLPPVPVRVERVAVLVCHGMGQQVSYETLDCVAKALASKEEAAQGGAPPNNEGSAKRVKAAKPRVSFARIGKQRLARAELTVAGADGLREVHVYEGYWAPLMEGRVAAWDVTKFLFAAGFTGLSYSWGRKWDRWMFGQPAELKIKKGTFLLLFITFVVVISALALYGALLIVALAKAVEFLWMGNVKPAAGKPREVLWHAGPLVRVLTANLLASPLVLPVLALIPGLAIFLSGWRPKLPPVVVRLVLRALCAWIVASAISLFVHWAMWIRPTPEEYLAATAYVEPIAWLGDNAFYPAFVITALIAVAWIRAFYIQYFGDVAAYVSSHKVNKFYEVREQVKTVGRDTARALYGATNPLTGEPIYQKVLVVGHSLGSVVAYDTLNGMINEDRETGGRLRVEERTEGLVTFGSPLDKTAFIFRTQLTSAVYREALAAANQPMIEPSDGVRRIPWINISSPQDPISGPIDFYDPEPGTLPAGHLPVDNQVDEEANIPAAAHTQYWENRCLARYLHALVTGRYVHPKAQA